MSKKTNEFTLVTTLADADTLTGVQNGNTDIGISIANLKTRMNAILDAGNYFSTNTVEAALQQIGATEAAAPNAYQPKDTDLTAIAALTTTTFGRSLLTLADAGAAATLINAQPLDTDLTAIAALATTAFGRSLLTLANAAAVAALTQPTHDTRYAMLSGATFTGPVVVPAASTAGHPLRYGQTAWNLGAGTMGGSLTISTPSQSGVTMIDNDATANSRRVDITVDGSVFRITSKNDAGGTKFDVLTIDLSNSQVDMSGAPALKVPAVTAVNQASRVSHIDVTSKRYAVDSREIGDTGWRDVTANYINGWTGGAQSLLLRRWGNICYLRFVGLNAAAASATACYTIPAAFSNGFTHGLLNTSANPPVVRRLSLSGGNVIVNGYSASDVLGGTVSWFTDGAFPTTTLPGVAYP